MPTSHMSQSRISQQAHADKAEYKHQPVSRESCTTGREARIAALVSEFGRRTSPVWPLPDYVAVNPFLGTADRHLLDARAALRNLRNCELLMPLEYYRQQFERGEFQPGDVASAFSECAREDGKRFADIDLHAVVAALNSEHSAPPAETCPHTIAELVDARLGSEWASHIVNDISRYCAAHLDRGQASWPSPWAESSLFDAWRAAARHSLRMDWLGINGFRNVVRSLPESSVAATAAMLNELQAPEGAERAYLLRLLNSVSGWAAYIASQAWQAGSASGHVEDLAGLLAIRLAYDSALAASARVQIQELLRLSPSRDAEASDARSARIRYVLQVATEIAYRRRLCGALSGQAAPSAPTRKAVQMVFCIDVRSEILRRRLEAESDLVETFGFAGFFGIAMEYKSWGTERATAQCPVLLRPSLRVSEATTGVGLEDELSVENRQREFRWQARLWRGFQCSAVSCFTFVESMGPLSLGKLVKDTLGLRRSGERRGDGLSRGFAARPKPVLVHCHDECVPFATQVNLAEGMLRNLGLTGGFARLVVLCGHDTDVTNNPYRAALACGACGGHSGEPNARVAARILNDADVRRELATRGVCIPADTVFVAAVHNTTTDVVQFCDADELPDSHTADLQRLRTWVARAGKRVREERCFRLGASRGDSLPARARDWSEVRPEWGLAGNAAFIVAPRERTRRLNLEGRTFLHSYDDRQDPDLRVLELIMTAPMVVTNWINLQYYGSTVDNRAFGSGNKTIHNVVGQFGVLQGNGGDLMTGLPWQCVHDGQRFQHEPLRLLVVIAAHRESVATILDRHASIRQLATNQWLNVVAWEDSKFFRWTSRGDWEQLAAPSDAVGCGA